MKVIYSFPFDFVVLTSHLITTNMQTKVLPAKYIMKTDDDAFVRIDEVLSSLKEKPPNGLLYGRISLESSPIREKDSKWYISAEVCMYTHTHVYILIIHANLNFRLDDILLNSLHLLTFDERQCMQEWPHASYPPWAHGPGYIISRDIAKFIAHGHQERDLQVNFTCYNHKHFTFFFSDYVLPEQ